jgi:hypothetical protein
MKRKLKIKPIYQCRCNGRLQTKRFMRLTHTGVGEEGKKRNEEKEKKNVGIDVLTPCESPQNSRGN